MSKTILVTGAAGFIGFHLCKKLLNERYKIIGIDNINDYYDVNLKEKRLEILKKNSDDRKCNWNFIKADLSDYKNLLKIFRTFNPYIAVNLAAQTGVRYPLINS